MSSRNDETPSWLPFLGIGIAVVAAGVLYKLFYTTDSDQSQSTSNNNHNNDGKLALRSDKRHASVCEMKCMGWYLRSCDDFKHPMHNYNDNKK